MIDDRGGDHTTNGIRMGVDGWIYIAVGDYGFHKARGKDGTTLSHRGGGILRVRPDGTELEVFATGLRNPFAIAIDPYLNLFTRDNTNDGAGWDVRVSHLIQTADYGYPRLFANFPDEIMPPLGAYGQGGGTGRLFLEDEPLARGYRGALLTGDWGRSEVYRHDLRPEGASFRRIRGLPDHPAADRHGHRPRRPALRGELARRRGQRLRRPPGRIRRLHRPAGLEPSPPADLAKADLAGLGQRPVRPDHAASFHCQREILRRGPSPETTPRH